MRLDVGCGLEPSGDVNCDLYVEDTCNHRGGFKIPVHGIPNFVRCDAFYLPFRSNSFDMVFSGQLIEHTKKPLGLFKELVRVSSCRIIVESYHWFGEGFDKRRDWLNLHHVSKMSSSLLTTFGSKCGCKVVKKYVRDYVFLPHRFIPLIRFPTVFGVEFMKT